MQIPGKLTREDVKHVGTLVRPRSYYPRLILSNTSGALLLVALAWSTIRGLLDHEKIRLGLWILWLAIGLIIAYSVVRVRRSEQKSLTGLNSARPDLITVDATGLQIQSANGVTASVPWRTFKGWRERGTVILLDWVEGQSMNIIPTGDLSDPDREMLRGTLRSHLGEATKRYK